MLATLLLTTLHVCVVTAYLVPTQYNRKNFKLSATDETKPFAKSLWSERVEYVDLLGPSDETSPTARPLPLFLLNGAFYPSGTNYIHVFEMKYRTMMFDCANSDELFGYIHTDYKTGSIAKYGTMCKITDRQLLEDGRQFIAFEGVGRFKVRKILKTLPYVLGEVEPNVMDEQVTSEDEANTLEMNVYKALKFYIRLMQTYEPNKDLTISQAAKRVRPSIQRFKEPNNNERRTMFSFSLCNMIQMTQDKESQLMLQTTDIMKRLGAQEQILTQACEMVSEQLAQKANLTEAMKESIKALSYNSDIDADILPPDVVETKAETEKDEWDLSNIE